MGKASTKIKANAKIARRRFKIKRTQKGKNAEDLVISYVSSKKLKGIITEFLPITLKKIISFYDFFV